MTTPELRDLPLAEVYESPWNPRRHYNQAALEDLVVSFQATGQLTPITVRPHANGKQGKYEIGAGHRRFRAATRAGLATIRAVVQEMDDVTFVELLNVENLQRDDLEPLDEARGYQDLIKIARYDVRKIAERTGKSVKYVYDRLKLLQLITPAQELLERGRITPGHAILLARLTTEDQARAIEPESGLWRSSHLLDLDEPVDITEDEYAGLAPVSVREFDAWIDRNVRFDLAADHVPLFFPETLSTVQDATAQREKVVEITHEHHVRPEAKHPDGRRTYGPQSWKRADGQDESDPCEYSVVGVVVVGEGRGESFRVCIAKKKCAVHWAREQQDAASATRARETGATTSSGRDRWAEERAREERARAAWKKAQPAILQAVLAKIATMPVRPTGPVVEVLRTSIRLWGTSLPKPKRKSLDAVLREFVTAIVRAEVRTHYAYREFPKLAKAFGVNAAALVKAANPPEKKRAKKTTAKRATRKKAR